MGISREIDGIEIELRGPLKYFFDRINWPRRSGLLDRIDWASRSGLLDRIGARRGGRGWRGWGLLGCAAVQETLGGFALLRPVNSRIIGYRASSARARFGEASHCALRDHQVRLVIRSGRATSP